MPLDNNHPKADRLARTTGETDLDPSALREDLRRIQHSFASSRRTEPRKPGRDHRLRRARAARLMVVATSALIAEPEAEFSKTDVAAVPY